MNVVVRATRDTLGHLKTLVSTAFVGLVSLVALKFLGGDQVALDEVPYIVAALTGTVAGLSVNFVWNLAASSFRIERDAHSKTMDELAATKRKLEGLEADRAALLTEMAKDCPVWIDEASGATVIGRAGETCEVRGGTFPNGIRLDGHGHRIIGSTFGSRNGR